MGQITVMNIADSNVRDGRLSTPSAGLYSLLRNLACVTSSNKNRLSNPGQVADFLVHHTTGDRHQLMFGWASNRWCACISLDKELFWNPISARCVYNRLSCKPSPLET
jgi:hypothetical protein